MAGDHDHARLMSLDEYHAHFEVARAIEAAHPQRLTRIEDALLEMRRFQLMFESERYQRLATEQAARDMKNGPPETVRAVQAQLVGNMKAAANALRYAVPFLWREEARQVMIAACKGYEATGTECWWPDLFPRPVMYWTFETNIDASQMMAAALAEFTEKVAPAHMQDFSESDYVKSFEQVAMLIDARRGEMITCCFLINQATGMFTPMPFAPQTIGGPVSESMATSYATFEWLQSPLVTVERERMDRAARRRNELSEEESYVHVVKLRRVLGQHAAGNSDVDWHYRWLVRGHWRQQYYPTLQAHRPKWISPYIKGPEGKPLKEIRPEVFTVVR